MKVFQDSSLNNILYLFEHKLHDPMFEQTLFQYLSTCDAHTLLQNSPIYGNLLSALCHLPKYYNQIGFESAFILLMNHMVIHLNLTNKSILNTDLLLNGSHPITILMLLLKIKHFEAAEICLAHLEILAKKRTIINRIIETQLFQKDENDQFHLSSLLKECNLQEHRKLLTVLAKSSLYFNIPKQQLMVWLGSLINKTALDLYALLHFSEDSFFLKLTIFEALVIFCDSGIIHKHDLMLLLKNPEYKLNLIDFTLTQNSLNLDFFISLLLFYETLFHHRHLTKAEYLKLVLVHPHHGYSIMHQLIFKGYYVGLFYYLNHLEYLLKLEIISISELKTAYLITNTKGFNCFYQAVNSFHPSMAFLFLNHLVRHFSKMEVFELVSKGSHNPLYDRYFRPRCTNEKKHAFLNNRMLHELKKRLRDELQGPAQQNSFFLPNTTISKDEAICQELSRLGISL